MASAWSDHVIDARLLGDPGAATFQVSKYPFFLLNRLVSQYNTLVTRRLRTIGIDIPTWRVLMILGEANPRGMGEIAQFAIIKISTLTRIVQRMSAAGLVTAQAREGDNRVTEVSLTALGNEQLAAARRLTAPIYSQVITGFSRKDFNLMMTTIDRIYLNLASLT